MRQKDWKIFQYVHNKQNSEMNFLGEESTSDTFGDVTTLIKPAKIHGETGYHGIKSSKVN